MAQPHLQLCKLVYNELTNLTFSGKILTEYYNFPAYIQQDGIKDRVSLCFKAKNYDISEHVEVQSDLDKFVTPRIRHLGLTLAIITVCERSLDGGKSLTPIWQVYYNVATIPSAEVVADAISKLKICKKTQSAQATGTQTRAPVQQGEDTSPDGEIKMPMNGPNMVPKGDLKRVLWHKNMYEVAHESMETPDSPLSIAVSTPAHTVIFKRELNNITNMPPGMKAWAMLHQYSNATRCIHLKFISAATLINELVVGIAPVSKTTYTIQELQLIHWVAINPQDVTATIDLKLADVAWGTGAAENMEVNKYTFSTSSGTDTAPINIPTLVLMTRVGIQNSYANPDVSIQIAITECFKDGQFLVSNSQLNSYLPTTINGYRQSDGTTLSEFLNIEKGKPFHITCDGASVMDKNNVLPEDLIITPFRRALRGFIDATTEHAYIGFQTTGAVLPYYVSAPVQYSTGGKDFTFGAYTRVSSRNNAFYQQTSGTNLTQTAFNPPYIICVQGINHRNVILNNEATNFDPEGISFNTLTATDNTTENMYTMLTDLAVSILHTNDIVISRVPVEQLTIQLGAMRTKYINPNVPDDGRVGSEGLSSYQYTSVPEVCILVQATTFGQVSRSIWYISKTVANNVAVPGFVGLDGNVTFAGDTIAGSMVVSVNNNIQTDPQLISSLVEYATRNVVNTLDPNFSRLAFPSITPQTIPSALASAHTGVEFDDPTFVAALRRKFTAVGIDVTDTTQLVLFNLSTIVNGGISIVVVYNPQYQTFFIANNPVTDTDYFKVYRKLTYEDVVISQVRAVDKVSSSIPTTNTGNWLNRVTTNSSIFNGQTLVNPSFLTSTNRLRPVLRRQKAQAAAAAAAAGSAISGIVSSIFAGVFGLLAQKELNQQQLEIELQKMQVLYEQKANLMDKEFNYKKQMLDETLQNNLAVQGLKSGLPARTQGLGQSDSSASVNIPPTPSLQQPNSDGGFNFNNTNGTVQWQRGPTLNPTTVKLNPNQNTKTVGEVAVLHNQMYDSTGKDLSPASVGTPAQDNTPAISPIAHQIDVAEANSPTYGLQNLLRHQNEMKSKYGLDPYEQPWTINYTKYRPNKSVIV